MPEKLSSIDRIIEKGLTPDEEKEILVHKDNMYVKNFRDQEFEDLKKAEIPLTAEQSEILGIIDEETNLLRRKYGLSDFNVPARNFHVIPPDIMEEKEGEGIGGVFYHNYQTMLVEQDDRPLVFADTAFHEMIHMKSHGAAQITLSDKKLTDYRCGWKITDRKGEKRYFHIIDEAVTEELSKRFIKKYRDHSLFKKYCDITDKIKKEQGEATSYNGRNFSDDEFYSLDIMADGETIRGKTFAYESERRTLWKLISKIYEKNKNKFDSIDDIFEMLAKAKFTGNIMTFGRLVENTFGKGVFRKIGEYGKDETIELEKYIDTL